MDDYYKSKYESLMTPGEYYHATWAPNGRAGIIIEFSGDLSKSRHLNLNSNDYCRSHDGLCSGSAINFVKANQDQINWFLACAKIGKFVSEPTTDINSPINSYNLI
jgi:hypothetical protein